MQSHTRPLVTNITIPINPHLCLQLFSFTASWLVLPFSNKQWIWKAPITLLHLSAPWWVSLFWSGTLALQSHSQLGLQVCHPVVLQCLLAANAAFAVLYFTWGNNPPKIVPSHGEIPNLTCGSLGPPMSSSQTACCLVSHFSAAHQRLYNEARHVLPRLPFSLGGSGPPPNKWFLGPTQVHNQTILIGSAVCAWLTVVQQTDRHTDHGIVAFVATGCIFALHACDAA